MKCFVKVPYPLISRNNHIYKEVGALHIRLTLIRSASKRVSEDYLKFKQVSMIFSLIWLRKTYWLTTVGWLLNTNQDCIDFIVLRSSTYNKRLLVSLVYILMTVVWWGGVDGFWSSVLGSISFELTIDGRLASSRIFARKKNKLHNCVLKNIKKFLRIPDRRSFDVGPTECHDVKSAL